MKILKLKCPIKRGGGKKIRTEYANAITTRVSASNDTFVLEVYEEGSREF